MTEKSKNLISINSMLLGSSSFSILRLISCLLRIKKLRIIKKSMISIQRNAFSSLKENSKIHQSNVLIWKTNAVP